MLARPGGLSGGLKGPGLRPITGKPSRRRGHRVCRRLSLVGVLKISLRPHRRRPEAVGTWHCPRAVGCPWWLGWSCSPGHDPADRPGPFLGKPHWRQRVRLGCLAPSGGGTLAFGPPARGAGGAQASLPLEPERQPRTGARPDNLKSEPPSSPPRPPPAAPLRCSPQQWKSPQLEGTGRLCRSQVD